LLGIGGLISVTKGKIVSEPKINEHNQLKMPNIIKGKSYN